MVTINDSDANELGIKDGDRILLRNELGEVEVIAKLSNDVPQRVLWSPRQLVGLNKQSQNVLIKTETQRLRGEPYLTKLLLK